MATRNSSAGQSARLVYSRTNEAVGCSDEPGLRQAVARRLGYDPFVAVSVNTVVAELRGSDADGLKARVYVVRDGNMAGGARELTTPSRDCTELMAAVALALSIAIDPDALDRVEQPGPAAVMDENPEAKPQLDGSEKAEVPEAKQESEPRDEPRAAVTIKKAELTVLTAPARRSLEVTIAPLVNVATGPAPRPTFGLGIAAGLVLDGRWVAAIEPALTLKSSTSLANTSAGVRVNGWGGALHGGYQFKGLYGGVLVEAARLTSEGYGVLNAKTERSWWAGAGLRVGYAITLTRHLSLVPHIDGVLTLRGLRLRVLDTDVHVTPPLLGRLGLAFQARF